MGLTDWLSLLHPFLAIAVVFPFLGIVLSRAWKTRERRLEVADQQKSKIPPVVGQEHVQSGKIFAGSVVSLALLGLAYPIFEKIISNKTWTSNSFQVVFIVLMFAATIASLVLLYRAQAVHWRAIFATLTGIGLIILGCQDGVFRRTNEWYWSHYYFGVTAALLMIFSLAIIQDIYRDRSQKWRTAHVVLNIFATVLFLGQGFTGSRDLLEIPLAWQKPYIYSCDYTKLTCPTQPQP